MIEALDIRVRGIVQGVGFRPFVYRLARRYLVNGWVLNDLDGVFIHAEAETKLLDEFVTELHMNPPAAAHVKEVELAEAVLQDCDRFEIRESEAAEAEEGTLVSADLATCDDCVAELFDPDNRRFRYPFVNCTNCGPRFTIIDALPYDRPQTSMASFKMCPDCAREYADVADRRFHAQPDACFVCGPRLSWTDLARGPLDGGEEVEGEPFAASAGATLSVEALREASDAVLAEAVDVLCRGGIVAVKGLGGFHLACDAANEQAIAELRRRKRRDGKAFAVMVPTVEAARETCEVSDTEAGVLRSPARPIVLVRKRGQARLAAGLADKLPELGVMLPATPVQHLLLHDFEQRTGRKMLVMTSGNVHDEPIVVDDGVALEVFAGIADGVLGNDRPILSRYDDSVVRVLDLGDDGRGGSNEALQFVRRARGYAPVPIVAPPAQGAPEPADGGGVQQGSAPVVFAAGSEQKNTFAYRTDGQAYVSQHIGDMEDADVMDAWFESKGRFEKLFGCAPEVIACDAHPEYLASKWARETASGEGLPLVEVQHHHAHIASVLGEHGLYGPAIGIAFDGTGYGADGAIWGGEVLLANQADFERFANFAYVPMPGGAAAIKNPLRMAYGLLWAFDLLDHPAAAHLLDALGDSADVLEQMIEAGLNTPMTSSVGRLFDAVSALLGICTQPTYEGEAAILLDAARAAGGDGAATPPDAARAAGGDGAATPPDAACAARAVGSSDAASSSEDDAGRYAIAITKNSATETSTAHDTSVVLLDAEPTVRAILDDMQSGRPVSQIAQCFHDAIVDAIVQVAQLVQAMYGIRLVALSGGCFMNRYLVEQAARRLGKAGFTVALNANLPPNDGCISFGQAVVAASR